MEDGDVGPFWQLNPHRFSLAAGFVVAAQASAQTARLHPDGRVNLRIVVRTAPIHFYGDKRFLDLFAFSCQRSFDDECQKTRQARRGGELGAGQDPL